MVHFEAETLIFKPIIKNRIDYLHKLARGWSLRRFRNDGLHFGKYKTGKAFLHLPF